MPRTELAQGHELGFSFTPMRGKRPVLDRWQERERATLEETLSWAKGGNVGLRTGRASGVVVLDVDKGADIDDLEIPDTPAVETPGGGYHVYFRAPECETRNTASKIGKNIDFRGDQGVVVYPGSIHPDTNTQYEWVLGFELGSRPLAELPESILATVAKYSEITRETEPEAKSTRYGQAALEGECRKVREADNGSRNDTLNNAAFKVGQLVASGGVDETEAQRALLTAATTAGLDHSEAQSTIQSGLGSGKAKPRHTDNGKRNETGKPSPVLLCAADVAPEEVVYSWFPYIPRGKLSLLDGDPGLGKSWLTIEWAARASRGQPLGPGGAAGEPQNVLLLPAEDGAGDTLVPRLKDQGADLERIKILKEFTPAVGQAPQPLLEFGDWSIIDQALQSQAFGLMIVDPLMVYVGEGKNTFVDNQIRPTLSKLAARAEKHGISIIGVRHLAKERNRQAVMAGQGSIGFIGIARSALLVARDPYDSSGERRIMAHSKANLTKKGQSLGFRISQEGLEWNGTSPLDADALLQERPHDTKLDEAMHFLTDKIEPDGSIASNEVKAAAEDEGISERTLERAKKVLGIESRSVGKKGERGAEKWVWSRPKVA